MLPSRLVAGKDSQSIVIPTYDDRDLFDAIRVMYDLLNVRPKPHGAGYSAGVFKISDPVDDDGFGIVEAIGVFPGHDVETHFPQVSPHLFRNPGNAATVEYFDADPL